MATDRLQRSSRTTSHQFDYRAASRRIAHGRQAAAARLSRRCDRRQPDRERASPRACSRNAAGGKAEATLIGDTVRVPATQAAFANAISSHSIELDDIDVLALFHFSPPVFSAALAAAEQHSASGKQLLVALAAGCEMMERVSRAANSVAAQPRFSHDADVRRVRRDGRRRPSCCRLTPAKLTVGVRARRRAGVGPDGDVRAVDAEALQSGPGGAQRRDGGGDGAVRLHRRGHDIRRRARLSAHLHRQVGRRRS